MEMTTLSLRIPIHSLQHTKDSYNTYLRDKIASFVSQSLQKIPMFYSDSPLSKEILCITFTCNMSKEIEGLEDRSCL